ncbi:MAG: diaminopimelate epimerase [Myxococcales bacterium]|nr:diaminopimelate epimerase [Myxococcales bacterium]
MRFAKLHGLGNDFVLIERAADAPLLAAPEAASLCNRSTGIGADGTLELLGSPQAGWRLVIRNADGSRPEMCGNGLRCVGRYLANTGRLAAGGCHIETDVGPRLVQEVGADIRVDMGPVRLVGERAVQVGATTYRGTLFDVGNPHFILWGRWPTDTVLTDGPLIERASIFPAGVNVAFAAPPTQSRIKATIWERGSGLTGACGSGACAIAAAAWTRGHRGPLWIEQPGGTLHIEEVAGHVHMTGPAAQVFVGELSAPS